MPLSWVGTLLVMTVSGALAIGGVLWKQTAAETRAMTHIENTSVHLDPEVEKAGGVVTKRTLRRVLREMKINCEKALLPSGVEGFVCGVTIPEVAE